jgi:hypothetical protein
MYEFYLLLKKKQKSHQSALQLQNINLRINSGATGLLTCVGTSISPSPKGRPQLVP